MDKKQSSTVMNAEGKAQEYLAMMEGKGYKFEPIVRKTRKNGKSQVETDAQFTNRINAVMRDVVRLAHVSTVYDDVYEMIHKSSGEEKERWLVVESLLNDESIRIKDKLGIRSR